MQEKPVTAGSTGKSCTDILVYQGMHAQSHICQDALCVQHEFFLMHLLYSRVA